MQLNDCPGGSTSHGDHQIHENVVISQPPVEYGVRRSARCQDVKIQKNKLGPGSVGYFTIPGPTTARFQLLGFLYCWKKTQQQCAV